MKLADMLRLKNKSTAESDSIIPEQDEAGAEIEIWKEEIKSVPIDLIEPSPFQPRFNFDEEGLKELAASISEHGVLHPIAVREIGEGYQLIAGERRLRACKLLGWETIPCIIKNMDDRLAAEMGLIENLQRRDLHFLEETEGYQRLIAEFNLTQEELAKRIGKSQSSIANRLRLLKLDKSVRDIISREMISERHARALLKLDDKNRQLEVIQQIIKSKLTVRQTEDLISKILNKPKKPKRKKKIILKDIRLFTNSVKELAGTLTASGLSVDYQEEDDEQFYKVTVLIRKPERGGNDGQSNSNS